MKKKGQMNIGGIVLVIMMIFVGLALIQAIFTEQTNLTTKTTVTNELIDFATARDPSGAKNITNSALRNFTIANAYATTDWQYQDCPFDNVVYGNSSTTFILNTDYRFDSKRGIITLLNTSSTTNSPNATYIDYNYCHDGYNKDSGSRGIAGIIGLFAAMALLGGILYYIKVKDLFD